MSAAIDITGRVFGQLTAIEPTDRRRDNCVIWRCRCACGKEVFVAAKDLRSGNTKSCGCLRRQRVDITGQTFGLLTALEKTNKRQGTNYLWRCRCTCGKEKLVTAKDLRSGNTKSCGCLNLKARPEPYDRCDGTRISALGSKPPKSNTSGVRGVSWSKQKQDWEAYIKYKGVHHHLGHFKSIEEAAKARARAEEQYFQQHLEKDE